MHRNYVKRSLKCKLKLRNKPRNLRQKGKESYNLRRRNRRKSRQSSKENKRKSKSKPSWKDLDKKRLQSSKPRRRPAKTSFSWKSNKDRKNWSAKSSSNKRKRRESWKKSKRRRQSDWERSQISQTFSPSRTKVVSRSKNKSVRFRQSHRSRTISRSRKLLTTSLMTTSFSRLRWKSSARTLSRTGTSCSYAQIVLKIWLKQKKIRKNTTKKASVNWWKSWSSSIHWLVKKTSMRSHMSIRVRLNLISSCRHPKLAVVLLNRKPTNHQSKLFSAKNAS